MLISSSWRTLQQPLAYRARVGPTPRPEPTQCQPSPDGGLAPGVSQLTFTTVSADPKPGRALTRVRRPRAIASALPLRPPTYPSRRHLGRRRRTPLPSSAGGRLYRDPRLRDRDTSAQPLATRVFWNSVSSGDSHRSGCVRTTPLPLVADLLRRMSTASKGLVSIRILNAHAVTYCRACTIPWTRLIGAFRSSRSGTILVRCFLRRSDQKSARRPAAVARLCRADGLPAGRSATSSRVARPFVPRQPTEA